MSRKVNDPAAASSSGNGSSPKTAHLSNPTLAPPDNFLGVAKSGWYPNDPLAYAIVKVTPKTEFFVSDPNPSVDYLGPEILLYSIDDNHGFSKEAAAFLSSLDTTCRKHPGFSVDMVGKEILLLLDYASIDNLCLGFLHIGTRYELPFTINRQANKMAKAEVCLLERRYYLILLVVIEDMTFCPECQEDPDTQVAAAAIAAFQSNNSHRQKEGLPLLPSMTIPCITMNRTHPTFYLVPITEELNQAIIAGERPTSKTVISKSPTLIRFCSDDGMDKLDFRKLALQRFLAFKSLAEIHWRKILEGVPGVA